MFTNSTPRSARAQPGGRSGGERHPPVKAAPEPPDPLQTTCTPSPLRSSAASPHRRKSPYERRRTDTRPNSRRPSAAQIQLRRKPAHCGQPHHGIVNADLVRLSKWTPLNQDTSADNPQYGASKHGTCRRQPSDVKVKSSFYIRESTQNRARAAFRATAHLEDDETYSDFAEKAILAEVQRREALVQRRKSVHAEEEGV